MLMKVHASQRQSVLVTAQTVQSVQMLQYSHEELETYLSEQAERNPFLEVGKRAPTPTPPSSGGSPAIRTRATSRSNRGGERGRFEEYCAERPSLRDHLHSQLRLLHQDATQRLVSIQIIDSIDTDGYLRRNLYEMADTLGVSEDRLEAALNEVQSLDPVGVGARNLREGLRIQLNERGLLSVPMAHLVDNLDLLAKFDVAQLTRQCGVSREDVLAMIKQVRAMNPRPGSSFDQEPVVVAVPDIFVRRQADESFSIELNTSLMPRVLVNRQYYAELRSCPLQKQEKAFVTDCMQQANWIARQMEQRANTVLKVATEIVAQQHAFFRMGLEHLRPLNLRDVAEAVGVHPSTVCRAIANKFMLTDRGTFELRYFFDNAIASADGGEEHSAQSIRFRIRDMIERENPSHVLSDDAIVDGLRREGVDIARRTVAKYREMLRIPSSSIRRRLKAAGDVTPALLNAS